MEVLSKRVINGYNKNAKMMMHHINNLALAFDRIKQENIRVENIGPNGIIFLFIDKKIYIYQLTSLSHKKKKKKTDIYNENVKLILGLIWTLICHYQIDELQIDLDEPEPQTSKPKETNLEDSEPTQSKPVEIKPEETKPKKPKEKKKKGKELLIAWLQKQTSDYDNVPVKDLTTSFKNGLLMCALVDSVNPNLINYKNLDPVNKKKFKFHFLPIKNTHIPFF